MIFKRGRLPVRHDLHTMRGAIAMHAALATLSTPPTTSTDYVSAVLTALAALPEQPGGGGGPWGEFMNGPGANMPAGVPAGGIGDCTIADSCHTVMQRSANGGSIVVPTNAEALAAYEVNGGYVPGDASTDQGCDETTVCRYMQSTGLAGVKSAGSGMVDPAKIAMVKWAIQIFGGVRLGIIVDQDMEQRFVSLQPWETAADPNDPDAGGHDTPAYYYDANYLYVVTWAGGRWPRGLQPIAWPLIANPGFCQEVHVEVFPDFCRAGGTTPAGFPMATLLADLPQVTA